MKLFKCVTFGCRVNQYETQAIREQLLFNGYKEAPEGIAPHVVVINSCTVTEAADRECVATVKTVHAAYPDSTIVVTGCLVQRDAELLKKLPGVRLLVGSNQKHRVSELLESLDPWTTEPSVETELNQVYAPLRISEFEGRSKAFLKVQDGCDRACAFCKIPLVRGRARSRRLPDILQEVHRLVDHGFQEIVLTGVAIGLWGREWADSVSLANLVEEVDRLPGRFRVRLSSLDPRDLDDLLLKVLGSCQRVSHHLHLSLQSGSDPVLERMNRGYTAGWYREKVASVRRYWPDLGLTTDLIVGFPGETEQEFEETVEFCRELDFAKVHVFPYSRRRGTSAWFFKNHVPSHVIKTRAAILRRVSNEVAEQFCRRFVGTAQEVLAEQEETVPGPPGIPLAGVGNRPRPAPAIDRRLVVNLTGYTGQFIKVVFPGYARLIGQILPVVITETTRSGLLGFSQDVEQ